MARYRTKDVSRPEQWAKLAVAFTALRALGLTVKSNFMYCGGCASAAIADQFGKAVTRFNVTGKGHRPAVGSVFYHRQGREGAERTGQLYLYYGRIEHYEGSEVKARSEWCTMTVGHVVVKALTDAGLMWWWSGDVDDAIVVNVGEDAAERRRREEYEAQGRELRRLRDDYAAASTRLNELCAIDHCGAGEAQLAAYRRALARLVAATGAVVALDATTNDNEQRTEA